MGGFTFPEINTLKKGHPQKTHTPRSIEVGDLMKKALVFSMAQTCAGQLNHRSSRAWRRRRVANLAEPLSALTRSFLLSAPEEHDKPIQPSRSTQRSMEHAAGNKT